MNLLNKIQSDKTSRNNIIFTIALLTILVYSSFIFGGRVYLVAIVAIVVSAVIEYLFHYVRKIPLGTSLLISPLLLTLLLPPTIPLWMAGVGSFFGTFFAKSLFGGEGKYIFNPAVVGILFLLITFPAEMNTQWLDPVSGAIQTFTPVNSLAFITPFEYANSPIELWDMFTGMSAGAIGETVRLGILLVGALLVVLKVIDYKLTVSFLVAVFVVQLVFNFFAGPFDPVFSVFTGMVVFASVFIVPDPVIAPSNTIAKILYTIGLATITVVIRMFAAFPEGVIFALIIMSAIAPLLESTFEKEVTE